MAELTRAAKFIQENIDNVGKLLESQLDTPVNQIGYALFVKRYLPLLADDSDDVVMQWVSLTGHPYVTLEVYDDNTSELLYTIPPMLGIRDTVYAGDRGMSISDLASKMTAMNADSPAMASEALYQNLMNHSDKVNLYTQLDTIIMIDDILVAHGYPTTINDVVRSLQLKNKAVDGPKVNDSHIEPEGYDPI